MKKETVFMNISVDEKLRSLYRIDRGYLFKGERKNHEDIYL